MAAENLISNARAETQNYKDAAQEMMMKGALWCIGGIVVTFGTYSLASGGGTYIIAWGAIVFGAVKFVRGLIGYIKS